MLFKSPLVVGYKGEIGSFILNGLLKTMPKASNIWCFDINDSEKEKLKRIKKSDYIFLCVPIKDTVKWLIKYKKNLKNKIIIEQASLKEWIYNDKRLSKLRLVPMHMLFRPSATSNYEDRKTLLIFNKETLLYENIPLIEEISKITNSEVSWCKSIKEHDNLMASNQALVHRTILALNRILVNSQDTYISKRIKELARRILSGDKELYEFIQENKYLPEKLKILKKELL